jgi:transcriptional regulator with XRE-family HTH domain
MAENNHPLAKYRASRNLTQEALASELSVAPLTIWRWENGKRAPRPRDAKRISDHTGIPTGDLIEASLKEVI